MITKRCIYQPMDSWFFRESRPSDAIGNNELGSVFPPPVRTLLGALRTSIGEQWHLLNDTHWRDFDKQIDLHKIIGYGSDLGPLSCQGPFISYKKKYCKDKCSCPNKSLCTNVINPKEKRYYPAPANLMLKENVIKENIFFALHLDEKPVHSDIGRTRLACFPKKQLSELVGSKPAEGYWISFDGYAQLLKGKMPNSNELIKLSDLIKADPRLGIGRDNERSGVKEGLLYQTSHFRLNSDLAVEIVVSGLPNSEQLKIADQQLVRLGGEGRFSSLKLDSVTANPKTELDNKSNKIMIYFITPMLCTPNLTVGIPAGFEPKKIGDCDVWEGKINGVELRILSVVCGKTLREGGWDLATHQARAVESYLPAGSALFAELINGSTVQQAKDKLHDQTIQDANGKANVFGRGHMLIGQWFK